MIIMFYIFVNSYVGTYIYKKKNIYRFSMHATINIDHSFIIDDIINLLLPISYMIQLCNN